MAKAHLDLLLPPGLASARPAAASTATGALYYSTDTGVLERNTGAAWVAYSGNEVMTRRGTLAARPAANAVAAGTLYCVTDLGNYVSRSDGSSWSDWSLGCIRGLSVVTDFVASYSTIKSQALTLAAGDSIQFALRGSIFNNTGGDRTWTIGMTIAGETLEFVASAVVANGSTTMVFIDGFIDVHTSAISRFGMFGRLNPANADDTMTTPVVRDVWSFVSAVDFTGAQTLDLKIKSASAGAGAVYRASYRIDHLKA